MTGNRWVPVPGTNVEVSDDGLHFRWTFDRDGASYLATELYPDGTGKEMHRALDAADAIRRRVEAAARFGIAIVTVPR